MMTSHMSLAFGPAKDSHNDDPPEATIDYNVADGLSLSLDRPYRSIEISMNDAKTLVAFIQLIMLLEKEELSGSAK